MLTQERLSVQAQHCSPPPATLRTAATETSQEITRSPLWETLPAEHRRYLSQIVARVIARHSLLSTKEVPDD